MLKFWLPESRTHRNRFYLLVPTRTDMADAYVTVQQGEEGPRGGRSKIDIAGYFVQEIQDDAENPEFPGRAFIILKDSPECELYEVYIPPAPGIGFCTCDGWRFSGNCKHYSLFLHLVRIIGWRTDALEWGVSHESELAIPGNEELPY